MSEICPYCGTRSPGTDRCGECGGLLDELSLTATQIAMGPWFFRAPNKPFGPGCDFDILKKLIAAGKIKAPTRLRGPATNQLWQRADTIRGIAHLVGSCNSCQGEVAGDSKFCNHCGERFDELESDRDTVGQPQDVKQAIIDQRKADASSCPRCGTTTHDEEGCDDCGAVFLPEDDATQIPVGPWSIHDKSHGHFPGMTLDRLKKEIELGNVTGRSIVRGPSTQQFWKLAKQTPGIASLLGNCHACGEKVPQYSNTCTSCNENLSAAADALSNDNALGLRYTTSEAVAAAQKELDEQLQATGGGLPLPAMPKRPADSQTSSDEQDYQTYSDVETFHEPQATETFEQYDESQHVDESDSINEHEHVQDHDVIADTNADTNEHGNYTGSLAQELAHEATSQEEHEDHDTDQHEPTAPDHTEHAEHATTHEALASEHTEPAAHADTSENDIPLTGVDALNESRQRVAAHRQQKGNGGLIAAAVFGGIIVVGGMFLIMNAGGGSKDAPAKDAAAKDQTAKTKTPNYTTEASDQLKNLRKDAEARWATVKDSPREGKLDKMLTAAQDQLLLATKLYDKNEYLDSGKAFQAFLKQVDTFEETKSHRDGAVQSRNLAIAAKADADKFESAKHAAKLYEQATASVGTADHQFTQNSFSDASKTWEDSIVQFAAAKQFVIDMRAADSARAKLETDVAALYSRKTLDALTPGNWAGMLAKMDEGDQHAKAGGYDLAMDFYDQARQMIPGLKVEMRHLLGRKWFAYQTGRLTSRILIPKVSKHHPDEEMLAKIKAAYVDMQINRDFFNRIPLNQNCSYKDLATVMLIDCAAEIKTSYPGDPGERARASFNIGVNFVIVEKMLRLDTGRLKAANYNDIRERIRVLKKEIPAAGWDATMIAWIENFELTVEGEKDGFPNKSRAALTAMSKQLESYDTAIKITGVAEPIADPKPDAGNTSADNE